jgi:CBS domain.
MTKNPKTILKNALAVNALQKMEESKITSLFVVESEGYKNPIGVIHIHDIIKAGII